MSLSGIHDFGQLKAGFPDQKRLGNDRFYDQRKIGANLVSY